MSRRIQFGIAIPQIFPGEPVRLDVIRHFVTRAEALGVDSLWVQEEIVSRAACLDPIELLTYAAALTTRVRLGTAVLLPLLRGPLPLAKALSTLDQLSQGRLTVGVGLGGGQPNYPAFGIAKEARVTRFAEGLHVMKALWTEPRVTFKGRFWTLENAAMEPKPVQRPHPPLWFGARHPDALRRAIALGDGFIGAGAAPPEEFKKELETLRQLLAEAQRDPATFPVSKRIYLAVTRDKARAAERLRTWFGAYYGDSDLAARVSICGDIPECVDRLSELASTEIDLLILNPVFDELSQLEQLAADVMPRVMSA